MKVLRRLPGQGYLDTSLWIPKSCVNVEGTKQALTFPIFDEQEVRFLVLWRETDHHLIVPREFWDVESQLPFRLVDCRPASYPQVDIRSRIKLDHILENGALIPTGKSVQRESLDALLSSRGGILQLACGLGKSVISLELIARRKVPALIVVDTTQLLRQWREEIELFLDVPGGVGQIGDGEFDWRKPVVLATYTTLANRAATFPEEARRWFGLVIWDEAHHVAAPTFSRSADLFFGQRIGLTATPTRSDGMHVVYNFHIGKVLYKDLRQDLKPKFYFRWTGVRLDPGCDLVRAATRDKNGELHLGKLSGYFGTVRERLEIALQEVRMAAADGRKILVLSKSIDEIINLLAVWNGRTTLFTDIAYPTKEEVGESVEPVELDAKAIKLLKKQYAIACTQLEDRALNPVKREELKARKKHLEIRFQQHESWKKTEKLYRKRQREYLSELLQQESTGGLMIHRVDVDARTEMLRSKQVTFAIMKYGREGLNEKSLDTIVLCEPISDQGALQQLMGRILRRKSGKRQPIVVVLEDDVGPFIGMCNTMRQHLRQWSHEDGGPFEYELVGHPGLHQRSKTWARTNQLRT